MKMIITLIVLMMYLLSCHKESATNGSNSSVFTIKIPSKYTFLYNVIHNEKNGNVLFQVGDNNRLIFHLLLVDVKTGSVLKTLDSIPRVGGIACNGSSYFLTRFISSKLVVEQYDENLNKIKQSQNLANIQVSNSWQSYPLINKNGTLSLLSTYTSYIYILRHQFDKDLNLLKTDSSGNTNGWYGIASLNAATQLDDGSYIMALRNLGTQGGVLGHIFEKRDKDFKIIWAKKADDSKGLLYTNKIINDGGGNFLMAGNVLLKENPSTDYDSYLLRIDGNGNTLGEKVISTPWLDVRNVYVEKTSNNGYIYCMMSSNGKVTNYSTQLTGFDSEMKPLWSKTVGGTKSVNYYPALIKLEPNRHLLAYLDNSFLNSGGGFNLVYKFIDDNGELSN